jgi:hypothetical protein
VRTFQQKQNLGCHFLLSKVSQSRKLFIIHHQQKNSPEGGRESLVTDQGRAPGGRHRPDGMGCGSSKNLANPEPLLGDGRTHVDGPLQRGDSSHPMPNLLAKVPESVAHGFVFDVFLTHDWGILTSLPSSPPHLSHSSPSLLWTTGPGSQGNGRGHDV